MDGPHGVIPLGLRVMPEHSVEHFIARPTLRQGLGRILADRHEVSLERIDVALGKRYFPAAHRAYPGRPEYVPAVSAGMRLGFLLLFAALVA